MQPVSSSPDLPRIEERILAQWGRENTFQESLNRTRGKKPTYTFYDGPPFATGLPHYGHILAGTIKDVVTRYATMTGHHVERRFGWDCHGLPVEYEIDKKLGITQREQVLAMGVDKYNAECRAIVMRYSQEWRAIVERSGRWIDFDNDYKTLNTSFMESVWWVFGQMFDKGLVYRGYKVMPYSTACATPLSNFEAGQNYQDAQDPAVIVSFPIVGAPDGAKLLAWTTTPWTLVSNLALCLHPEFDYVKVRDAATGNLYWMAEARLSALYRGAGEGGKGGKKDKKPAAPEYEIVERKKGAELVGTVYEPLFPHFASWRKGDKSRVFTVLADTYVTADAGTGIVHQAPAFGEDDYRVAIASGVLEKGQQPPCPIDYNGCYTDEVPEWRGVHVKTADKDIMRHLKETGRLVHAGTITHSVPFCWRSDTPLIYRSVPSWFVNVESLKDRLLANNLQSTWVPAALRDSRFHNWLADARDWAISRSRFWGTPIPLWVSDDLEEVVCVKSVKELMELTGAKDVKDLHRDFIDHLTVPSRKGKGVLRRVDDVFDCWFESGSMPYAHVHYPFEHEKEFKQGFPADFIAEGLDQTRGWFYTLLVISTALFDKPAFKNLIVNGLVLAADGKKMSKRLKNYPEPTLIMEKYGADALRIYLCNSPVMRADPLRFREEGVHGVVRDVVLPWWHSYRFFVQTLLGRDASAPAIDFNPDTAQAAVLARGNLLDHWLLARLASLVRDMRAEMDAYKLYQVVPPLISFLGQLTNVYIRLNRGRLRGSAGAEAATISLQALFQVLLSLCRLMAPLTPFIVEEMYANLRLALPEGHADRQSSVHFLEMPQYRAEALDAGVEAQVGLLVESLEAGRVVRERHSLGLKLPLSQCTIVHRDPAVLAQLEPLVGYLQAELNVRQVVLESQETKWVETIGEPDSRNLGKRLGQQFQQVLKEVKALSHDQLLAYEHDGTIALCDGKVTLGRGDIEVKRRPHSTLPKDTDAHVAAVGGLVVVLDLAVTEESLAEQRARDVVAHVQKLRKAAGLVATDRVDLFYEVLAPGATAQALHLLDGLLGSPVFPLARRPDHLVEVAREDHSFDEGGKTKIRLVLCRSSVVPVATMASSVKMALLNMDYERLVALPEVNLTVDGIQHHLVAGRDYYRSVGEALKQQ